MRLFALTTILTLLSPTLAGVSCYDDGQPFNEQWTAARIKTACGRMAGNFFAGQSKHTCVPMGDDKVEMRAHNRKGHSLKLHKHACVKGMHHIINECGGFGDNNHGGHSKGDVWSFDFDPNEGGC